MYSTSDIRRNLKIDLDGEPYVVVEHQFVKPGKGNAFTRVKIKSMITGRVLEKTWRTGETLKPADLDDRDMQYLYSNGETYTFMDTESYDQVEITKEQMGDAAKWLIENTDVAVLFFKGDPINIELPTFMELDITFCEPGVQGDRAQGATKPATLETGAEVQVPLFINEGEKIKVDTRSGEYVGRSKS